MVACPPLAGSGARSGEPNRASYREFDPCALSAVAPAAVGRACPAEGALAPKSQASQPAYASPSPHPACGSTQLDAQPELLLLRSSLSSTGSGDGGNGGAIFGKGVRAKGVGDGELEDVGENDLYGVWGSSEVRSGMTGSGWSGIAMA